MKLSELKSHDQIADGRREADPEYAAEADRLELADAVSRAVVRYRSEHNLTQTAFGNNFGWKQPHVARLERGDVTPSIETLQRLARAGVVEVHIEQERTYVQELASA
ncbi:MULTISPECIES: helix-turn-helix domain-containing protein [Kocuria]|uniref:Helix-turn-helix transcriptional regulator n=2 Tax=Kocuria TaxID=57493 RepID=A0A846TPG2_9MICC|nr:MULTISPECIES: helix-turn-helix transcriptional regulator [Kocuria]NKE08830.1 helix-turn-helix transcriptional regulator [Kocuria subflava]